MHLQGPGLENGQGRSSGHETTPRADQPNPARETETRKDDLSQQELTRNEAAADVRETRSESRSADAAWQRREMQEEALNEQQRRATDPTVIQRYDAPALQISPGKVATDPHRECSRSNNAERDGGKRGREDRSRRTCHGLRRSHQPELREEW